VVVVEEEVEEVDPPLMTPLLYPAFLAAGPAAVTFLTPGTREQKCRPDRRERPRRHSNRYLPTVRVIFAYAYRVLPGFGLCASTLPRFLLELFFFLIWPTLQ
jgi:hypothetical protein